LTVKTFINVTKDFYFK